MHFTLPLWKLAPFTRLLFPAMAGILAGWYIPLPLWYPVSFGIISGIAYLFFHSFSSSLSFRFHFAPGMLLIVLCACFFFVLTLWNNPAARKSWYGHIQKPEAVETEVLSAPVLKDKYFKTEVRTIAVYTGGKRYKSSGTLYLYLRNVPGIIIPKPGTVLISKAGLQPIKSQGNPGGFNYAQYGALRGIYHAIFAKPEEWKVLSVGDPGFISGFINELRTYALSCIRKYLPPDLKTQGIAEALVVGYKEDLDPELLQAYSHVGVVHIIAISGLHLALVYYILSLFISMIPGIQKSIGFQSLLCIVGLWIFALVSGASPSVLRSAVMFSFVLGGKSLGYKGSVANALACSAFFLLLYNPYYLWDIGFQLSYLAVIGIVAIQDPMYRMLYFKSRIARYLWKACTVTMAAQISTLPFCLYYFHRFPLYFLPANLVAVPLSSAILVIEFFVIAFSWQQNLALYAGKLAGWMLVQMNTLVQFLDQLPGSSVSGIFFPFASALLVSLSVLFLGLALIRRKYRYFIFSACLLVAALMVNFLLTWRVRNEPVMVLYNAAGHTFIDFYHAGHYYPWGDRLRKEHAAYRYVVEPSRIYFASTSPGQLAVPEKNKKLVTFCNKHILRVDSLAEIPKPDVRLDILIISQTPKIDMDSLLNLVKPGKVVFDASNNLWKIAKWKTICERLALPCFSVPEQGAFVYFPLRK